MKITSILLFLVSCSPSPATQSHTEQKDYLSPKYRQMVISNQIPKQIEIMDKINKGEKPSAKDHRNTVRMIESLERMQKSP